MKRWIATLSLALSTLAASSAQAGWTVSTIDTTVGYARISPYSTIGYGHNASGVEVFHVAYQKRYSQSDIPLIYFTSKTGNGAWTTPVQVAVGRRPRMAMGGLTGDTPIIAYTHAAPGDQVGYAYPVTTGGNCGNAAQPFHCEIVTASSGASEVAVAPGSVLYDEGWTLFHAEQGAPWTGFDIHSPIDSYDHPSMDFRANGADVMAFSSGSDAFFRTGGDQFYDMQDVGTASSPIVYTDIHVDSLDVIRVAFNNRLYTRNGVSWSGRTFTTQSVPHPASIATTSTGPFTVNVAVAWGNSTGLHINGAPAPNLRPQTFDIDRVSVGPVDAVGAGTNRYAIVYHDATNDALKLAVGFY